MQPSDAPPPIVPQTGLPHGYEFLQAPQKQHRSLLPGGTSKRSRIIIVAVLASVILVVGLIVMSLLASAGKGGEQELLKAAQTQAELIRVSTLGAQKARDPSTQNRALTAQLSLESDQAKLIAAAKKQGIKINPKDLAQAKNSKTDTLLSQAEQANRFDEVFLAELTSELSNYQATLKKAYDSSSSKAVKAELTQQYANVGLLVQKKS